VRRLEEENLLLRMEFQSRHGLERIIGVSPGMVSLFKTVRAVAPTSSTVLITGESGTGKELIAQAIHALSPRSVGPFVSINCGALPENLLESELFGHVKGAFTDAHQNKKGLFEAAHHGSLFLDEVSETPPMMQVKLLRALQERRIRRVGATDEIDVDVRVITATNRSLAHQVKERAFREDLFYRLNVIPLEIPPLRERREDIPLLAEHFLKRYAAQMARQVTHVSPAAMKRLVEYSWPGNVRELENVIERAVALETSPVILPERLPDAVAAASSHGRGLLPDLGNGFKLDAYLESLEEALLRKALGDAGGDRAAASRLLGVSTRSLRDLLHKHQGGIDKT
jgi:two-component system response regulator PilR (NtrC family)